MANVFYVEEMNATSTATAAATFGTTATVQPTVNYSNVSLIDGGTAGTASTFFSFYLDMTSTVPRLMGVTNTTSSNFNTLVESSAANSTSAVDKENITDDFLNLSALKIFGTQGQIALFTNLDALKSGYNSALTAVGNSVNTTLTANSTTKAEAGDKLIQQISSNYVDRFALMYRAEVVPNTVAWGGATAAAQFTANTTHTGCTLTQLVADGTSASNPTTSATVELKMGSTGVIESIYVTTNASQWTSNTGTGYVAGRSLSISKTIGGNLCIIKIPTMNTVQAAILNGTLDNSILYNMTKSGVLNLSSFGTGTLSGSNFISTNNIASTVPSGGVSQSGTGATFDVVMSDSTTVGSIKINTTGNSYVVDNNVVLTLNGSTITIVLTAALVAVINNVDSAGYGTFPVPTSGGNFLFTTGAVVASGTSLADGEYTTTVASGGASQNGAGAKFTVDMNGEAITSIVLLEKATTPYVLGNILTLTNDSKTITLAALTNKSLDIINNGLDGTTYSIPVVTTGSTNGAGAYVDVTMRDSSYIETIANSTYNYDFGMGAVVASGTPVSGAYTVTAVGGTGTAGGTGGNGATFNVIMQVVGSTNVIAGIRRFGANPTTLYATGNVLTLTGSGGTITLSALTAATTAILNGATTDYDTSSTLTISAGTAPIKLMDLNISTMAAAADKTKAVSILNGTANALTTTAIPVSGALILPTNVPLESGDKIRMKQTIGSATGQKNTVGEAITYEQTAFVDYSFS
jgi:hypothetical protein